MNFRTFSVALCVALAACNGDSDKQDTAPPPPVVTSIVLKPHSVPNILKMPGRVEPLRTAEVRARVTGIVEDVLYDEGADVDQGQPLFLIDPRQSKAAFAQAKAALQRAEATAANTRQMVKRYSTLIDDQAISQQEYDSAVADSRGAIAAVAEANAAVDVAQLNLDYTSVASPIAGRTSRARVRSGSLVSETEATLLTVVRQLDKVYVNLSQSTSDVLEVRREITEGVVKVPDPKKVEVKLIFENGAPYGVTGHLDFLDLTVMEDTGAVIVRAEFDNPKNILLPGQFVRAKIYAGERPDGLEVPQRSVTLSKDKATVMLVGENNIAAVREVELGMLDGDQWLIKSGLNSGDRVIVDGLQKVRDGAPVRLQCEQDGNCDAASNGNKSTSAADAISDGVADDRAAAPQASK